MANQEQRELLRGSRKAWNDWREENFGVAVDLSKADLRQTDLTAVNLSGADLTEADLSEATLWKANLAQANLRSADLSEADLSEADLSQANLSEADLRETNLSQANLSRARFIRADLGEANLRGAVLTEADLSEARLSGANLSLADLSAADLRGAGLAGADLSGADLTRANLSGAELIEAKIWQADLTEANLRGADLTRALLLETTLAGSTLSAAFIWGTSVWDVEGEPAEQTGLVITPDGQPPIYVDDLEVAQFIYLLLNRRKLRNVLDAVTRKGVLILGRFGNGGLEVLEAIAERVRELGYLPMLFEFEPAQSRDFTETVQTMVGLARFVIADLSGPSVLKELEATVKEFEVPFVPILEKGRRAPSMTADLTKYYWFRWPPVLFASQEDLIEMLKGEVIDFAEGTHKEIAARRAKLLLQSG